MSSRWVARLTPWAGYVLCFRGMSGNYSPACGATDWLYHLSGELSSEVNPLRQSLTPCWAGRDDDEVAI